MPFNLALPQKYTRIRTQAHQKHHSLYFHA